MPLYIAAKIANSTNQGCRTIAESLEQNLFVIAQQTTFARSLDYAIPLPPLKISKRSNGSMICSQISGLKTHGDTHDPNDNQINRHYIVQNCWENKD
jgi:hypothetical protein